MPDAFLNMYFFENTCRIQIDAQSGGAELNLIGPGPIAANAKVAKAATAGQGADAGLAGAAAQARPREPGLRQLTSAAAGQPALLSGPILPLLLRFALPNMAAMLATALAAMAETGFVGSMGVASLAGMALVFPMVMLQQMLSAGAMGGGVSSAVSRALGAGDRARANALVVHAMWIGLASGLASTLLMLTWGPALYAALGGRGDALAQAVAYSNVAFLGAPAMWMLNTFASVIRGSGNMRVPSITLLTVAATQVLVGGAFGLGWFGLPRGGMAGLAWGQVIAFLGGALVLLAYLRSPRSALTLAVRGHARCAAT